VGNWDEECGWCPTVETVEVEWTVACACCACCACALGLHCCLLKECVGSELSAAVAFVHCGDSAETVSSCCLNLNSMHLSSFLHYSDYI